MARIGGAADVAGRQAPGYCHLVNALGTGAGAPDRGLGRDPPDQAWLGQLAEEQAALRRVATLVAGANRRRGCSQRSLTRSADSWRSTSRSWSATTRRTHSRSSAPGARTGAPAPTPVGGQLPLGGRNMTTVVYRDRPPGPDRVLATVSGVIGQVASRDWGLRSSVGVPVSAERRLWGCIVVAFSGHELLPPTPRRAWPPSPSWWRRRSRTPTAAPSWPGWPRSRRRCAGSRRWWPRAFRRRKYSRRSPRRSGGCLRSDSRTWSATTRAIRLPPSPRGQAGPRSAIPSAAS